MIRQYTLNVENSRGEPFRYYWAYQFYGAMIASIGSEDESVIKLHSQDATPISQYLRPISKGHAEWTVSLMGESIISRFSDWMESWELIRLRQQCLDVSVAKISSVTVINARELLARAARGLDTDRFNISFITPTSFKSAGEHALFPTVTWIVKSLISKWNSVWPDSCIEDEDAVEALIQGLRISNYRLQSSYYHMKGARIPAFIGEIGITAKLPVPLLELWKPLVYFGGYSGVGVKCALGMGGITVRSMTSALPKD